jgi:hypothetical protein
MTEAITELSSPPYVDFCGETFRLRDNAALVIGREGDVVIDDNPYLHRRLLELTRHEGMVWIANVGASTTVTMSDVDGLLQSWLSPGARVPLVFPQTVLWFTAGPTTYELDVFVPDAPFVTSPDVEAGDGATTIGRVSFTPDQRLLVVALAEDILRRGNRGAGAIPPSAQAARRLGWTITKFNRKLDNVCEKLARMGVRGLVSDDRGSASNRRSRLVEYTLAARLVTTDDLAWLDALDG